MEDKTLEKIVEISTENGLLKKENEYLKKENEELKEEVERLKKKRLPLPSQLNNKSK